MERKQKGKVNIAKKILGFIPGILYNILAIICVLVIAIIVIQKITDSKGSVYGYKIFKVVSGSMEPKYDVGEVVICKEISAASIKIGDAIVYEGKIGDLNGRLVMHEVVDISRDEKNQLQFYAKGLNNSRGDPQISESQILGVVKFKSGILTLLYRLATSIYSAFIIITLLVLNVFISFKSGRIEENEEDDEDSVEKSVEKSQEKTLQEKNNLQQEMQQREQEIDTQKNIQTANENKKNEEIIFQNEMTEKPQTPVKKATTRKTVSSNEKEEESVIDSKEKFDKIDNVEKSVSPKKTTKTTSKSAKSTSTKKTTSATTKKNGTKAESSAKSKTKKAETKAESSAKSKTKKE